MKLTSNTKLFNLIDTYPFLLEFLVSYNPKFENLKNPVMRNTLGRIATLEMIASMGGVPIARLMEDIREAIKRETGIELETQASGGAEDKKRMETMKEIIRELHAGGDADELKERFAELIQDVDPSEIAQMEQQLISEGLPASEITPMCDIHARIFSESLDSQTKPQVLSGHPVHTFMAENRAFEKVIAAIRTALRTLGTPPDVQKFSKQQVSLLSKLIELAEIEKHYVRKENQLFPFLEKYHFSGPTQVMWTIHDNVRALLKRTIAAVKSSSVESMIRESEKLLRTVEEMIYKEEKILFPMALDFLQEEDWVAIRRDEADVGYALVTPDNEWTAHLKPVEFERIRDSKEVISHLPLDTGILSLEQVNLILTHLPVELSFIDENDEVRYYSQVPQKIFPRSPEVIGRKVQNCHPPKSVHLVNKILAAFRAGEKDVASFWIQMNEKFIYIRYFAVRDKKGNYRGSLEVVQDVADIRKLKGERRLLEWESP